MRTLTLLLLVFAAALFVTSGVAFLLDAPPLVAPHLAAMGRVDGGAGSFAQPMSGALGLLLWIVWGSVLAHAVRSVVRHLADLSDRAHDADHNPDTHGPLILSLLAAAAWPWIAQLSPLAGVLAAAAMMTGALISVLRGDRDGGVFRRRSTVGIYAGWATAALFASFAGLLEERLGLASAAAAIVAVVLLVATAAQVQLRLGTAIGFAVAVIWSLIGMAAGAMATDASVVTAAVIGIAAMTVVLVRVTT